MTPSAMIKVRNAAFGLLALAAGGYTVSVAARPFVPNNWGPDKHLTCAAIIPGSGSPGRHYYAWWNPNWPAPHNTLAYAVSICNTWFGGTNSYDIPPIANTPHSGPHQYNPPKFVPAQQLAPGVKDGLLDATTGGKNAGSSTAVDATAGQTGTGTGTTKP